VVRAYTAADSACAWVCQLEPWQARGQRVQPSRKCKAALAGVSAPGAPSVYQGPGFQPQPQPQPHSRVGGAEAAPELELRKLLHQDPPCVLLLSSKRDPRTVPEVLRPSTRAPPPAGDSLFRKALSWTFTRASGPLTEGRAKWAKEGEKRVRHSTTDARQERGEGGKSGERLRQGSRVLKGPQERAQRVELK